MSHIEIIEEEGEDPTLGVELDLEKVQSPEIGLVQNAFNKSLRNVHWIGAGAWAGISGLSVSALNFDAGFREASKAGGVETAKVLAMAMPALMSFEITASFTDGAKSPLVRALPVILPSTIVLGATYATHLLTDSPDPVLSTLPVFVTAIPTYSFLLWNRNRS